MIVPERSPHLSPRQRDVLQLRSFGWSDDRVGHLLGVSRHTVRTHLAHAKDRLGVRTIHGAVAMALRAGLIL